MEKRLFKFASWLMVLLLIPFVALSQQKKAVDSSVTETVLQLQNKIEALQNKLAALEEREALKQEADIPEIPEVPEIPELPEFACIVMEGMDDVMELALANVHTQIPCEFDLEQNDKDDDKKFDVEKNKIINKEFQVSAADKLDIVNKFGKVHINTWDKNVITVAITIIARANADAKAQEVLKAIDVEVAEDNTAHLISFKTKIDKVSCNHAEFEINYVVYMPYHNSLRLKNSFGDTYVANHDGELNVEVKYGSLKTDRLTNSNNVLSVSFGALEASQLKNSQLDIAYSKCTIDEADVLKGKIRFSEITVKKLNTNLDLATQYSPLEVRKIAKDFNAITVDAKFGEVELRFDPSSSFNFNVNLHFCDLDVELDKKMVQYVQGANQHIEDDEKPTLKHDYKGSFGASTARANVNVVSKYGNVSFDGSN